MRRFRSSKKVALKLESNLVMLMQFKISNVSVAQNLFSFEIRGEKENGLANGVMTGSKKMLTRIGGYKIFRRLKGSDAIFLDFPIFH